MERRTTNRVEVATFHIMPDSIKLLFYESANYNRDCRNFGLSKLTLHDKI